MSTRRQPTNEDSTLGALGFTAQEERVYVAVLSAPSSTVSELARQCDVSRSRVAHLLDALVGKGCVSRLPGRVGRYVGTSPDLAVEALILRQEEQLERARLHSLQLLEHVRTSGSGTTPAEVLEVLEGEDAIQQRLQQLQRTATSEVRILDRPPYVRIDNPAEYAGLERDLRYMVIYSRQALEIPEKVDHIRACIRQGEEARVCDPVPVKMFVADRRMALVSHRIENLRDAVALLVHSSSLLEALVTLFDLMWIRATPLHLEERSSDRGGSSLGDENEARDHEVTELLNLLAVGLKDEAVARRMSLSSRTVSRRINQLMDDLGASTRFQAGVEATRRGWVAQSS